MSRSRFLPSLPSLQPGRWPGIQALVPLPFTPSSRAGQPAGVNGSGHDLREREGEDRGRAGWGLRRPGPRRPLRGGRPRQRRPARAGQGQEERPAPPLPVLRLSCSLGPGRAATLTHDVLARVGGFGIRVGTVALDLAAVTDIAPEDCAALCSLHGELGRIGTRLTIAVSARPVLERLRADGVLSLLGAGAVYPSLRAAVLAVYAAMPGPGLVTSSVLDALTVPADPLDCPGEPLGQPAQPPPHAPQPLLAEPAQRWAAALSAARHTPRAASPAPDGVCPNVWLVNCSNLDQP